MAENSRIQWTHHTFNPWRGCPKVSAGCANCYADVQAKRNPDVLGIWGPNGSRVLASESMWREPLKWDRAAQKAGERRRVFCASMADVFEDWEGPIVDAKGRTCIICDSCKNPDGNFHWDTVEKWEPTKRSVEHVCGEQVRLLTMQDVRVRLFNLIDATPNLDWLVLTKRPENIARMLEEISNGSYNGGLGWDLKSHMPNVWIGTSVENQKTADERIPHLLRAPAAVRFLSCEPLLGPVKFDPEWVLQYHCANCDGRIIGKQCLVCGQQGHERDRIDWVITGGESGPKARECQIEWIRSIVKQCNAVQSPVFVKQLGERLDVKNDSGMEWPQQGDEWETIPENYMPRFQGERVSLHMAGKGGNIEEWPEDLRIRQFPVVKK